MKIAMIIGSHPRHAYVAKRMADIGCLSHLIIQQREKFERDVPPDLADDNIAELYKRHFKLRAEKERQYFGGDENLTYLKDKYDFIEVESTELNGTRVVNYLKQANADLVITYGPNLISEEIIHLYENKILNIHGGLSPWYKGSATMFWPFYFLEPNYVGTTIHHISIKIDGGNIVHQVVPELSYGDTMHDVACKAMVATCDEFEELVKVIEKNGVPDGHKQTKNGKLFLVRDWRPEHLKLIYETYEDKIVDKFLNGEINRNNEPKLIRAF